jgi:hypothetical protein
MIDYFSVVVVVHVGLADMTVLLTVEVDFVLNESKIDSKQANWTFEY